MLSSPGRVSALCQRVYRHVRLLSTSSKPLRIGYVPEHFSTPLHVAKARFSLHGALIPYPSGTGHMIEALKANELDVSFGLTESFVADLAKNKRNDYGIVGPYVETPLCWSISAGAKRDDINSARELNKKKAGISRMGSGSYIMAYVLADKFGWLDQENPSSVEPPFEFVPLDTFARLRDSVNNKTADFFMWENFTSKRYYDNGSIKRIGEIYTPWSSWKVAARNDVPDESLEELAKSVAQGTNYFNENPKEVVKYISTNMDYAEDDVWEWMKTVAFAEKINKGISKLDLERTLKTLKKAGLVEDGVEAKDLIREDNNT